ncbi:YhbC-like protein (fragment) (modular protein) [Candidatus Contendobacter odensis Run_B_J11]|uniref:Ribosome maturation factor RimP n=2 Tax=Candidatus Contendibacter odensensis TaxID=1400860 RepID=A0A7U7J638_9GAMM
MNLWERAAWRRQCSAYFKPDFALGKPGRWSNKWAVGPFFIFAMIKMRQDLQTLSRRLATVVESMGYELVGVEFHPHRTNALLRVYIDSPSGITLGDCQRVSHQLSGLLEVEDPIEGQYNLEISSPGLERPLFEAQHFVRFAGSEVRIQLRELLDGRRKLIGRLLGMHDDDVMIIDNEGREWRVPLERIEKARLVPEL